MADTIQILSDLQKSATQYRRELLCMPVETAQNTLQHMTGLQGLKGSVTLGELSGAAEIAPYKRDRRADASFTVTPRTLPLYLGSAVLDFDPNEAFATVYGAAAHQGEALKSAELNRDLLFYVAGQLGKKLNAALWSGKRDAAGTTTAALFDGFDTITQQEITAGTIAEGKGNLFTFNAAIDKTNACDLLQDFYEACAPELQGQAVKVFMSRDIYNAYCRCYRDLHGALPYNQEFKKTTLEGSDGLAELVPLSSKKGSPFVHIAPKANLVYGYGGGMADETLAVEKYAPFTLTMEATMAFGLQFRSVSPEALMVGKLKAA